MIKTAVFNAIKELLLIAITLKLMALIWTMQDE